MQIIKEEIALQLALKQLDNFKGNIDEYGGDEDFVKTNAETAARLFSLIHESLKC